MKIKRIKLKNFGIHRDLEFETNSSPVVGLLGKNGSGKSTVLDAVKYALTGEIEGKIEDACTVGQKKGYVELLIDKDSEEILLKREVGKTPKKQFSRNGKKISSAKDIEQAIQEMMAVDKKAMSNACFLRQGSLNELLFGSDTSREKLFIKLVNLSFCERYTDVIDKKISLLQVGIEDLNSVNDLITESRMDAVVEKELLEKELSRTVDYAPALDIVADSVSSKIQLGEYEVELHALENDVTKDKAILGNLLLTNNVTGRDQLENKNRELMDSCSDMLERKAKLIDEKNIRIRYNDTLSKITTAKAAIEHSEIKLKELELTLSDLQIPDIHLEELANKAAVMQSELEKKNNILLHKQNCTEEGVKCYACGQELDLTEEDFVNIQKDFEAILSEHDTLQQTMVNERALLEAYEATKNDLNVNIEVAQLDLNKHNERFVIHTNNISEVINGANMLDPSDEITDMSQQLKDLNEQVHVKNKQLAEVVRLETRVTTSETLLSGKRTMLGVKYSNTVNNAGKLEEELTKLGMDSFIGIAEPKLKLELEARQAERHQALGELKKAKENFKALNVKFVEIQSRMSDNEAKLKVVEELRQMKDILSRKGLPRAYVSHKFDKLASLTATNLAILNADFTVSKDADNFLSFLFERYDGKAHVVLPMDRLSGGQKVRLCIAFLLAVQQELVPDIGFQTFDEPSTHLDEEGVERLCAMFKSLQSLLRCVNHQVWICDHNPLLEESFNTTLRL